ncbi:sensor histidine kinase [Neptunomonas japonica]|uniref:sensor histidine kinase n=1 Tax=Neptunomonas japonica TaxID=417574 RepID=UPI00041737A2|nr:sensor histidine kinase [Neptunomonas japonica]
MSRRFFWKMVLGLLAVSLMLFSVAHEVSYQVTSWMTEIKPQHRQSLINYSERAEQAYIKGDSEAFLELTEEVESSLGVWSAVRDADGTLHSNKPLPESLADKLGFQRQVDWPVHTFMDKVLIGFPLSQKKSFIIELPKAMHPRPNTSVVHTLLAMVAPSLMLMFFCCLLYRYLMRPLEALNQATLKLAGGCLDARVGPQMPKRRRDEITQLASSFDSMAERLQRLINSQRQLLGDLSHELRTPLTRIELALDLCRVDEQKALILLPRIGRETELMQQLVSDALTLAWLDGKPQIECVDSFNLATLLDLLCEDASFEYPNHKVVRDYEMDCPVELSNQRALAQAIENVLRNALRYSPPNTEITLRCQLRAEQFFRVEILDQGEGVAEEQLEKIFEPFFRTDKARTREQGGVGLGLALVRRQVEAVGGSVYASNNNPKGLRVVLEFPCSGF